MSLRSPPVSVPTTLTLSALKEGLRRKQFCDDAVRQVVCRFRVPSDPFSSLDYGKDLDLPLPSGPYCCTDMIEYPLNGTIGVP
jgi:hypothetical protein